MVYLDWALADARGENLGVLVADGAFAVLYALAEALADHGTAQFCRRGRWPGHMLLAFTPHGREVSGFGPLVLELSNGTVAVNATLRHALGASPRPSVPLTAHPLGYSAGPDYGCFLFAVSHAEIRRRWTNEMNFAWAVASWLRAQTPEGDTAAWLGDYR